MHTFRVITDLNLRAALKKRDVIQVQRQNDIKYCMLHEPK